MPTRETKFIAKKVMHPVTIKTDNDFHYLTTPFALKDEAKVMKGAKWMGYDPTNPEPVWRVSNCRRNNFNIDYLEGKNPFKKYTTPLVESGFRIRKTRKNWRGEECKIYVHQNEMTMHMLCRKQCIISGEMGVGKTLSAFEAIELSLVPECWYVAPKSALAAVKLEAMKWVCRANIRYMTYDELKKILADWPCGKLPPRMVIYDESSRVKTPSSQRSQAAFYLAESMRDAYSDDCYIILMSGSPAPKSPLDWYWQCEIACPGFIREGDINKFQYRLALMQKVSDPSGVSYPKLLAWKDGNPNVCGYCGARNTEPCHNEALHRSYHAFSPIENEVEKLYRRMSGLVLVKFKKDCLDLPNKIYRVIRIKPSIDLIRAARLVSGRSKSAVQQLTLMRELSDGFQYVTEIVATDVCTFCEGSKVRYTTDGLPEACSMCDGTGSKNKEERKVVEVDSPKLHALTDLLEENEEVGRIVIYAGFNASIERIVKHCQKQNWKVIRVDGRGWYNDMVQGWDAVKCLSEFQDKESPHQKIAFIGHPGSAGMGITLTAASMIVYLSNDFNAESRVQSEDRIHRPGMDINRGATIVDMILLPTDEKVLDNLKRKKELQSISLGELQAAIDNFNFDTTA